MNRDCAHDVPGSAHARRAEDTSDQQLKYIILAGTDLMALG